MKYLSITVVAALALAGCGSTNNYLAEKTQTVEYYRIFDIKTAANRQMVAKAASNGMGRNVNNAQEAMPIPSSADIPEKAGRFKLVNPFEGSRMGALAALAGGSAGSLGPRLVTCEGAVWTAQAHRNVSRSSNLDRSACIFQYKDGYHLDLYAIFTKQEGGLFQISRDMAHAIVGTPEEWTEKTFLDIVRSIRTSVGAEIVLLEAQPRLSGTPWLDNMGTTPQRK
jgi:hypothetical protein